MKNLQMYFRWNVDGESIHIAGTNDAQARAAANTGNGWVDFHIEYTNDEGEDYHYSCTMPDDKTGGWFSTKIQAKIDAGVHKPIQQEDERACA